MVQRQQTFWDKEAKSDFPKSAGENNKYKMCYSLSLNLVQATHTVLTDTGSFLEFLEITGRNFRPERGKNRLLKKEKE